MRRTEFCELLKLAYLKAWTFKDQQTWLGYSQKGTVLLLERRQTNHLGAINMDKAI